ncbi:MAG: hypothetical protein ACNA77_10685, partial [Opitutales bacterium]
IEAIPQFVEELSDIAQSMGWEAQPINMDEAAPNFRGVIVNPKGDCEPLCFIFDPQGRLRALMDLITEQIDPTEYSFFNATKTQFAENMSDFPKHSSFGAALETERLSSIRYKIRKISLKLH